MPCSAPFDHSDITCDTFLNGRLTVCQYKSGYRFSIDSILLSGFVRVKKGHRIVDLGCGCGIIAMILAYRNPASRIVGIELQPRLADLARQNVTNNHLNERIKILTVDLKKLDQQRIDGLADAVVCNPPFGRPSSGRINPDTERALARHEIAMTIESAIIAARRVLRRRGRLSVVFPAGRMAELFAYMQRQGIEPKRLQAVQSYFREPFERVLVEGVVGAKSGMIIEPPLVIYQSEGRYSNEVQQYMK